MNFAPLKSAFRRVTHLRSTLVNFAFLNFVVTQVEFLKFVLSSVAELKSAPSNWHSMSLVLVRFANFKCP